MSDKPFTLQLEEFRAGYRALMEELLQLVAADSNLRRNVEGALLRSPLEMPAELTGKSRSTGLPSRLTTLVRRAVKTSNRDDVERVARAVLRDLLQVYEQAAVAPQEGERVTRGRPRRPVSSPAPPAAPPPRGVTHAKPPMRDTGGRTLGVRPTESAPADEADELSAPPPPAPAESRYMNAAIAGHRAEQPLVIGQSYLLEVWVDLAESGDASVPIPSASLTHRPEEEVIELTIQVTSDDFTVAQDAMPLKLPRYGPSRGRARFDVVPNNAGRRTLTIGVHKEGNFLLQMKVVYSAGDVHAEPVSVEVKGRPLDAATHLQMRKLSLTIERVEKGYSCTVSGATATRVVLPITEVELADIVTTARDALLSVVNLRDEDSRKIVFQDGIEVDVASEKRALGILARAGATLFQRLFFGPSAGADVRGVGTLLRNLATRQGETYTFQFNVDRFPVPWGMLYLGKAGDDDPLDWNLFLGMRHVIEQIPFQAGSLVVDTEIPSGPALAVSANFNTSIDKQYELDVVARQRAFWQQLVQRANGRVNLVEGLTRKDILRSFKRPASDQISYFYCHAESAEPGAPGGISASCFVFASDERLTLEEMNRNAPTTDAFPGNPLVFINACESAELRPEFYDGFIPYFMAKGARGVIGTECETPAIFATEWALSFFPRFLDGAPLGAVFLGLRREFCEKHRNPLGLLYNVYCNADTQVNPGLTI
jgi:hypothetical protein